jgi:DNA-binding transcriptional ArsR family regulator
LWAVFRAGSVSGIGKLENEDPGDLFAAFADPVERRIIEFLLEVGNATPGQVAEGVQELYRVSRGNVSTHITHLRELRIVRRDDDGTVYVRDPDRIAEILNLAVDWVDDMLSERGRRIKANRFTHRRRVHRRRERDLLDNGDRPIAGDEH